MDKYINLKLELKSLIGLFMRSSHQGNLAKLTQGDINAKLATANPSYYLHWFKSVIIDYTNQEKVTTILILFLVKLTVLRCSSLLFASCLSLSLSLFLYLFPIDSFFLHHLFMFTLCCHLAFKKDFAVSKRQAIKTKLQINR